VIKSFDFYSVNFEINNIKYNIAINYINKAISMFFVSLINVIIILRKITERLFK